MSQPRIDFAIQHLLSPAGLAEAQIEKILANAMGSHIDSADLYLQSSQQEHWSLEESLVKEGSFSIDRGFGLRVTSGEKTGFAYADEIDVKSLEQAVHSARSVVHDTQGGSARIAQRHEVAVQYGALNPLQSLSDPDKIALLQRMDRLARAKDPRVKQVMISLSASHDVILIAHSDGRLAADVRPLVHLSLRVIVEQKGRREQGSAGGGGRKGYEFFLIPGTLERYVDKAVRQALLGLEAIPAPAGTLPVILGPGWPAVLLHEAIGHGLEGDFNRKGSSAFSRRLQHSVASPLCTIVDDGTLFERRGSLTVDDEGTPTEQTVLIEKGVLKNYMLDKHNARLLNMKPTGNGRRESYAHVPLPRMTNTYMLAGDSDPAEIIASIERGIYAVDFSGGQVDITSGKFVFSTSEAYLIEKGKIKAPIKGATLMGHGPEVLTRVSMVGNDLALDEGIGNCGKAGQSVPVGVGQPTLKIDALTVGGV